MVEVGKSYYFMEHAYHHYIGRVVAITGKREVDIEGDGPGKPVVKVHSCKRGWTEFFRDGMKKDTSYDLLPGPKSITYFDATPWNHEIPDTK